MSKVLSPFPYYGGKAKMSGLICSLLDFNNTTIYVEPYGGGCRTLLNKKRHEQEIYNDFGYGLTTFMSVMADRDKTEQLIERLIMEEPSRERFSQLVIDRMSIEDSLNTSTNEELSILALECFNKYHHSLFKRLRSAIKSELYDQIIETITEIMGCKEFELEALEWLRYEHYKKLYCDFWSIVGATYTEVYEQALCDFSEKWHEIVSMDEPTHNVQKLCESQKEQYARECAANSLSDYIKDTLNSNEKGTVVSDIDIAFNIFQLYYCSRDGMGVVWSEEKNRNIELYYKAVRNLRNVSERMREVVITQCDALDLVRQYRKNENVMLYLDPSYLKPEDEKQNLGKIYRMSYDYEAHEKLLREITAPETNAKILISNYDVELYNTYLCDWNKTYYKTFTGVGSKKGNRRLEVLWKNY